MTYDMTPIASMLANEIDPATLATALDDVLWRWVNHLLASQEGDRHDAGQVYDLRMLADALKAVAQSAGN